MSSLLSPSRSSRLRGSCVLDLRRDEMALEPIRAILDVDTGVDDAMAIALAVAAPTIDLVAVTTVAGNVELEHTTRNTLRVLDFVGASHVPVYRGMSRPMDRPLHTASHVHGADGLGGADIPESSRECRILERAAVPDRRRAAIAGRIDLHLRRAADESRGRHRAGAGVAAPRQAAWSSWAARFACRATRHRRRNSTSSPIPRRRRRCSRRASTRRGSASM